VQAVNTCSRTFAPAVLHVPLDIHNIPNVSAYRASHRWWYLVYIRFLVLSGQVGRTRIDTYVYQIPLSIQHSKLQDI
jgi:hypothetical protein